MKMNHMNPMAVLVAGAMLLNTRPAMGQINFTTGNGTDYTAALAGINLAIPDNTPVGLGYALNFNPTGLSVGSVSVTLNISGGYNGDLYAYLTHGDTLVQLLYPNPAMSSSGFPNITLVAGGTPGALALPADGTALASGGSYVAYGDLGGFSATDPNGMWTLFIADLSPGDTSQLNSFTVSIMTVPEPQTWLVMGGGLAMLILWRKQKK